MNNFHGLYVKNEYGEKKLKEIKEKNRIFEILKNCFEVLTVEEMKDVMEYVFIILRKKEAKGELDYLKKEIK